MAWYGVTNTRCHIVHQDGTGRSLCGWDTHTSSGGPGVTDKPMCQRCEAIHQRDITRAIQRSAERAIRKGGVQFLAVGGRR